jgi:hypothetical protein
MYGLERLAEFSRAVQASRAAGATTWNLYYSPTEELQFAEGLLLAFVLVLPFWTALAYGISRIAR